MPHSSRPYRDEWGQATNFRPAQFQEPKQPPRQPQTQSTVTQCRTASHRFQQAEALHYLEAPEPKTTLQTILEQTRARHQARIYAYVFMPEHVHLLINEPPAILLSQFLKSFKQTASRRLKGDRDQFWQTRYFDRNIRGEAARTEVIHYIHRNPVKRGLVEHPDDYPWSKLHPLRHRLCGTGRD